MDGRSILSPIDTSDELAGSGFTHTQAHLVGAFTTADFRSAVRLLDAVAVVADELNHHPDVRLGWGRVEFALTSHDVDGVTARDLELARRIRAIADEAGAEPAAEPAE
jgi:4a-hydroxytetrahydrobiopterin dehydratase